MRIVISKYFFIAIVTVLTFTGWSQEKESDRLRKQQIELQKKIEFTENLLKSTEQSKTELTNTIGLINNKIQYREELVSNINLQLKRLNDEIISLEREIYELDHQLNELIDQYKKMIVLAYKLRSNTASLLFILSSENFNQANKRMEYMEQITKYRANQIRRINQTKNKLQEDLKLLEQKKEQQLKLANQKENEKQKYLNDLQNKKTFVS